LLLAALAIDGMHRFQFLGGRSDRFGFCVSHGLASLSAWAVLPDSSSTFLCQPANWDPLCRFQHSAAANFREMATVLEARARSKGLHCPPASVSMRSRRAMTPGEVRAATPARQETGLGQGLENRTMIQKDRVRSYFDE